MTTMTNSTVIIVPVADVMKANNFAWAMGWQPDPTSENIAQSFSVALSADGQAPATHYGTHTWGNDELTQIFADGKAGTIPDKDWAAYNLDAETVVALFTEFMTNVVGGFDAGANWSASLSMAGLKQIMPEIET